MISSQAAQMKGIMPHSAIHNNDDQLSDSQSSN